MANEKPHSSTRRYGFFFCLHPKERFEVSFLIFLWFLNWNDFSVFMALVRRPTAI